MTRPGHSFFTYPKNNLLYLSLGLIIFMVLFPCLKAQFISLDDPEHILQNPGVTDLSFESIRQIFSETVNKIYIPLTTLSFALEHYFAAFNPTLYHFDNLLLHIINSLLVMGLARKMGLSQAAAFGAA